MSPLWTLLAALPNVLSHPPTPTNHVTSAARPTCTVSHTAGADDSPAIRAAVAKCAANATILFEAGIEYNAFAPVMFTLGQDVTVDVQGNITLPSAIAAVQAGVIGSFYRSGWFSFTSTGPGVNLVGGAEGGVIRSFGQPWWDSMQQTNRPNLIAWRVNNGSISNLTISKPIGKSFNIAGNGNFIQNIEIDALSSNAAFPFNTYASFFDRSRLTIISAVGGDGNMILDSQVSSGDDCIAIGSPCSNLHVRNLTCTGTHGVSIAAKGGGQVSVFNIVVEDVRFVDSLYAARYKSSVGSVGLATNIVYRNIAVENVTFPVYITQKCVFYFDQSQAPPPPSNLSVTIDGLSISGMSGTINSMNPGDGSCISDPCWYFVAGADGSQAIIFDTFYPGSARNISVRDIAVVPDLAGLQPTVICNATTTPPDVGFKCWDGAYIPQ
ncbi:Glycoside hydrolase family 28 protein [Mycena kentingensis (nom. inval.)]|nr:Glycoside hydrolase family 28 protein [Mycena kentingensis (nom. inval.)]